MLTVAVAELREPTEVHCVGAEEEAQDTVAAPNKRMKVAHEQVLGDMITEHSRPDSDLHLAIDTLTSPAAASAE